MDKLLFQLLCLINFIIFHHAAQYGTDSFSNHQVYDLNSLFAKSLIRLQNSLVINNESPKSINLQFQTINPDAIFQSSKILLGNSKCMGDILFIARHFEKEWALRMFDSFGKLGSGILQGNLKWVGDYNECIGIYSSNPNSTFGNFHGQYCSVSWILPYGNTTIPLPLVNGICIPDSCSPTELQDILKFSHLEGDAHILNNANSALNVSMVCKPTERHLNTPAKAMIALLSVFCTLTLLGSSITAVKYFQDIIKESKTSSLVINITETDHAFEHDNMIENAESDDEFLLQDRERTSTSKINGCLDKLQTFLSCFCLFTNGAKLLNTDSTEGQLLCIHGIRFLSMSWIILGHTYAFCFLETRNIAEVQKLIDNFPFQVVLQGFYAVDSFFLLSGFLVAYIMMKEFDKKEGISWTYFYIHRYMRLTPIYMIVLGFSATVYFYIGSGPFWPDGDFDPICKKNWWWNLLYINNFQKITDHCMAWSWYLANDMQFFVISPIFLITLWRWPKIGYGLLATFLCASWLCNFVITYHYDLITGMTEMFVNLRESDPAEVMAKFFSYFDKLYVKPYTRISSYLIGILVGYLFFKHNMGNKNKYNWIIVSCGWIVASTVTLVCIYGSYHTHPTLIARSFYNALTRTCFALGLSWVIYICLIGQGGFVNSILSFKLFIPLSRLTYTAYLIHPMIISGYYASLKTTFEFSHPTMIVVYLGIMVVTYGLSLPISLILEYPIAALEKLAINFFNKKESS